MKKNVIYFVAIIIIFMIASCSIDPSLDFIETEDNSLNTLSLSTRNLWGSYWEYIPYSSMNSVSVGSDGILWGLAGANAIDRWNGKGWSSVSGALQKISVGNADNIWGINGAGQIFSWNRAEERWMSRPLPPSSYLPVEISTGSDGTVWCLTGNDYIYEWTGSSWKKMFGLLCQVSVGSKNNIWGVNNQNMIWRWNGSSWKRVYAPKDDNGREMAMHKVSVGSDGEVWGIGCISHSTYGYAIWIWSEASEKWNNISGYLEDISVGREDMVWGINKKGMVYRWIHNPKWVPGYEPGYWNNNSTTKQNNNCYNYGCNKKTNTYAQPGRGSGRKYAALTIPEVRDSAVRDGLEYVGNTDYPPVPPAGKDLVAMVIGVDYHWYRQDSDYYWSHKPGQGSSTNKDETKTAMITNPRYCKWNWRYTSFGGWFWVDSHSNQGQGIENIK